MTCMVDSGEDTPRGKVRLLYHPAFAANGRYGGSSRFSELTGDQLKEKLAEHNVSQQQFARIIRKDPTDIRDWCSGRKRIPYFIDLILELIEIKPEVADRGRLPGQRMTRDGR